MKQCEHCGKYNFEEKEKLIIQMIHDKDGQLSVTKIAKFLGVSYTHVNYYLEPMIQAGLIVKVIAANSDKDKLLMITPKGLEQL